MASARSSSPSSECAISNLSRMSPISSQTRGKLATRAASTSITLEARRTPGAPPATTMKHRISPRIVVNLNKNINNSYSYNQFKKSIYSSKIAFLAIVTFTSILLLTCLVNQRVSSLNCYTCSSADNPGCDESFSGRSNITDTDCEKHIGRQAKVCRKIVQYLENKKVVIRSCGWIDEHDDKKPMCYKRSGTFALMMESCICYEDNCNHSTSLVPNQSVSILLASGSMIFYYLIGNQRNRSH